MNPEDDNTDLNFLLHKALANKLTPWSLLGHAVPSFFVSLRAAITPLLKIHVHIQPQRQKHPCNKSLSDEK